MKCLLIYNQKCGKQDVVKRIDHIVSTLKKEYDIVDKKASIYDGETRDMARDACGKYDTIVVAGGDGTLHEVICGIGGQKDRPKIGILPSGTINDVSKSLKIPKNVDKGLDIILSGRTIKHDLFKINEEYGIYASAMGLLTDISYKVKSSPKRKFGKLAYYFSIPRFMFGHDAFKVDVDIDGKKIEENCSLLLILNSRSVAGRKVDKKNDVGDGLVNLVVFPCKKEKIKLREIVKIVMFFAFGMKKRSKNYKIIETSSFKIGLQNPLNLNIDGEKIKSDTYNFEIISPGIEIFC